MRKYIREDIKKWTTVLWFLNIIPRIFTMFVILKMGNWQPGQLTTDRFLSISMFSQVIDYGQEAFE